LARFKSHYFFQIQTKVHSLKSLNRYNEKNTSNRGAGFVGSHFSKRLLNEGNEIICLDNYFTGANLIELDHPVLKWCVMILSLSMQRWMKSTI
jgi:hypothetical protein